MSESLVHRYLLPILIFMFAVACLAEPTPIPYVDLNRYQGDWYEIARIPASFQKECFSGTMAQYELANDGTVNVTNSCDRKGGFRKIARGQARVISTDINSKLEVTFVSFLGKWVYLFGGDYWILYLDDNYQHVIVGHPKRTYGWILSRSSVIDKQTLQHLETRLRQQGYNTCQFLTTRQTDGADNEYKLCEVVRD